MIKYEEGYYGAFTREQAEGAIPNGTRIIKTNSEKGDGRQDGVGGVVLGSMDGGDMGICYFVEWDDAPKFAVGVIALKIKTADAVEGTA